MDIYHIYERVRAPAFLLLVLQNSKHTLPGIICTWLQQYKKPQIQQPGTTFSNLSDELRLPGGHRNCCRFATLTGTYQGSHICLAECWTNGNFGATKSRTTEYQVSYREINQW